jgi:hypothetical protein
MSMSTLRLAAGQLRLNVAQIRALHLCKLRRVKGALIADRHVGAYGDHSVEEELHRYAGST